MLLALTLGNRAHLGWISFLLVISHWGGPTEQVERRARRQLTCGDRATGVCQTHPAINTKHGTTDAGWAIAYPGIVATSKLVQSRQAAEMVARW